MYDGPDPWAFQRWAFGVTTGNTTRKAILSQLAMMADAGTGRCEAKQATLARGCETSERSVRDHLRMLVEQGLVARRPQHREDGGRRGDEFLLLAPWVSEWPDGHPARMSGGATGHTGEGGNRGECPGKNGHIGTASLEDDAARNGNGASPVGAEVAHADAREAEVPSWSFNGKSVPAPLREMALNVLADFNERAGTRFGAFGARGPSEHLKRITAAVLDHPDASREDWRRVVDWTLSHPWWGDDTPSVGVVFGARVVDDNIERARRETVPNAPPMSDRERMLYELGGVPA